MRVARGHPISVIPAKAGIHELADSLSLQERSPESRVNTSEANMLKCSKIHL